MPGTAVLVSTSRIGQGLTQSSQTILGIVAEILPPLSLIGSDGYTQEDEQVGESGRR